MRGAQGVSPLDPTKGTFEKVPLETPKLSIEIEEWAYGLGFETVSLDQS